MRNPKWHRDEIILALDLYFSPDRGPIDKKNPRIIELSRVLNTLPLISNKPDEEKFRNPDGVTFKLSNFLSLDKNYGGRGMTHRSKLDKKLFEEYSDKKDLLHYVATEIKVVLQDPELVEQAMSRDGKLVCEACIFVFEAVYGPLGAGFIECHHRTPLSKFKVEKKTTLDDLALVCSNCHRMLHKQIDSLSVEALGMIIKNSREHKPL